MSPSMFQLTDLNDKCLIHLFKHLDVISLAKLSKTCDRFYEIITNHIIPLRTIDFSTFSRKCSVRKMLALFGKSMTRIVVHEHDIQMVHPGYTHFAEFLRLLVEFGEPGKLKEMNLTFNFLYVPAELLQNVRPFCANLYKLEFDSVYYFVTFIKSIDTQNIRELCLHNIVSLGDWLTIEQFPNVEKLHLCFESKHEFFVNINDLILTQFISSKPSSLIDFKCIGLASNRIFIEMARHIPDVIECLGDIENWPNDANDEGGADLNDGIHKWEHLNAFTNLKSLNLRSSTVDFSDLGEVFSILAKRQTIEQLELSFGLDENGMDQSHPVKIADLKRLTRLETLKLIGIGDDRTKEFVNSLFINLPALKTCTIAGKHLKQDRIIELIRLAPHLKVLKFDGKFTTFSVSFYKKLVKCCTPSNELVANNENQLVIHIDGNSAHKFVGELGKRRYKPSIVMLRSI